MSKLIASAKTNRAEALEEYKTAKKQYLATKRPSDWVVFCDKKIICMKLGILI